MAAKKQPITVPVSTRALIQRINRALARDGGMEQVKQTRESGRARFDLGEYYIIDHEIPSIVATNIDLEDYGRELKVMAEWEHLRDEP